VRRLVLHAAPTFSAPAADDRHRHEPHRVSLRGTRHPSSQPFVAVLSHLSGCGLVGQPKHASDDASNPAAHSTADTPNTAPQVGREKSRRYSGQGGTDVGVFARFALGHVAPVWFVLRRPCLPGVLCFRGAEFGGGRHPGLVWPMFASDYIEVM
jgi:hypothetical protein